MKNTLVEFGEYGARIYKDPKIIEQKMSQDNVLVNPDISHLKGISPSFWVKNGSLIEAITPQEAHKMVFESEVEGGMIAPQKMVSFEEKLREVKKDFDAQRDRHVHYLLKALKSERKDLDEELKALEDKIATQMMESEAWVKNRYKKSVKQINN